MTIRPFVFVGVGGTGGKTLAVIYQTLRHTLDRLGIQEWPAAWQLRHVDVPTNPDPVTEGMPDALPRSLYVGLTTPDTTYEGADRTISASLAGQPFQKYLAWDCWRPYPPDQVRGHLPDGAGQYRAIGRVAFQNDLRTVDKELRQMLKALSAPGAERELRAIQTAMGQTPKPAQVKPVIFVVGSVAGGSGSGMLLDVCDLLRARGHGQTYAVVFTPEVFEGPEGELEGGVAPNTFMAMNELANAMWRTAAVDSALSRERLFARSEVGGIEGHSGPSLALLVGRRNGALDLPSAEDVYKVVGRSLAEMALNEDLTTAVVNFMVNNGPARAGAAADALGLGADASARDLGTFRGLGFARVSTGREFFERYAVERLQRRVSLRLLDQHLSRRTPGDTRSDADLLKEAVELAWPGFLVASAMDEVGAHKNDVSQALSPLELPVVKSALEQFRTMLNAAIRQKAVRGQIPTLEARALAADMVTTARGETGAQAIAAQQHGLTVRTWVAAMHTTLSDLLVYTAAVEGLPVAVALMDKLIDEVRSASKELRTVDAPRHQQGADARARSMRVLQASEQATIPKGADEAITRIVKDALDCVRFSIWADTFLLTATLLDDAVTNLLQPWRRALADADGILRRRVRPENRVALTSVWPDETEVPSRLYPSVVEFTLDDVSAFPTDFDRVMVASVERAALPGAGQELGGQANAEAAIRAAVTQIIRGANIPPRAKGLSPVTAYRMPWMPEFRPALAGEETPGRAQVALALELDDLTARIIAWMRDDSKRIGAYLSQSMGDYLTDPNEIAEVRIDRQEKLVSQVNEALKASNPLLSIDTQMLQEVHQIAQAPAKRFSTPINVPKSLPGVRAALDDLQAALNLTGSLVYVDGARTDSMIVSILDVPCHTVEVASVMEPIANQWLASSGNPDFWKYRRARPLAEWVPLSPNARRNLVLGWFAARLLGAAKVYTENGAVHLAVHDGKEWHTMVCTTVRSATEDYHVGSLLEQLPIQFIHAFNAKRLDPIQPYRTLLEWGAAHATGSNRILQWLATGEGVVDAGEAILPAGEPSREARQDALRTAIAERRESYAQDAVDALGVDLKLAQTRPSVEISDDIQAALDTLMHLLEVRPSQRAR